MRESYSTLVTLARENWKAGLTVALISVPLSIALSIASGAGPLPGIITGIWATALGAIFGSSNYNIIGAAGALTTVLFAATLAAPLGLGAAVLPFIAIATGILIFGIWLIGLDRFLYYIPSSVMYGFAAGVAFLIAASQLFDATGLSALKRTGHFTGDLALYAQNAAATHLPSVFVFLAFLAFILMWKRFVKGFPAVIPAAILGIMFGALETSFFDLSLISLGEKFGGISGAIAIPVVGSLTALASSPEAILWIFKASFIITLIAVLETLITAKIGDKITRTQSSPSKELFGLSLANIGAGLMGGLPATGVFIRTGANIKAGATHRMSAFLAAVFTAIVALIVLPFFAYLPVAVIAAILVNTAIGLIETEKFVEFWNHEKESFVIALLVAGITVFEDAGIAVLIGAVLALLLFANKISRGRFDVIYNFSDGSKEEWRSVRILELPADKRIRVLTYSIAGYLGYIDAERHAGNFRRIAASRDVETVILRLRDLYSIDYEGQEMLRDMIVDMTRTGKHVYISSAREDIARELTALADLSGTLGDQDMTRKTSDILRSLHLGVTLT